MRTLARTFMQKTPDLNVPGQEFMTKLSSGLNDAMTETVRDLVGDSGANTFRQARRKIARELSQFESKAFKEITDNVRNLDPDKLADYILGSPGKINELLEFVSKKEGSKEAAERILGARMLQSALNKATRAGGWDTHAFKMQMKNLSTETAPGQSATSLLWDDDLIRAMDDFDQLTREIGTAGGDPHAMGNRNVGRTEIAQEYAVAGERQAQASAAVGAATGGSVTGAVVAAGMARVSKFYKLAALEKIGVSNEAKAFILTDPQMRPILTESMTAYRDALKRGGWEVPVFFDQKAAHKSTVILRTWLARNHPTVYRRAFGPTAVKYGPGAAGVAGGLAAPLNDPILEAQGRPRDTY
jgi:hypothetical protein